MNATVKKYLITLLKFAISIGILAYLFYNAREKNPEQFDGFWGRQKHWGWLSLGLLSCFGAHLFSFWRWHVMVRALGLPFSIIDAFRVGFISSCFSLVAFGVIGGDSLRAFYVTRQNRDRAPEAISSVVADRILGLLIMFTFASVAFLMIDTDRLADEHPVKLITLQYACRIVLGFTAVGFLGVFTVMLAPQIVKTNLYQKLFAIPKVGKLIARLTDVVLVYRSKPLSLFVCLLMSIGVNVCFVVSIFSIAVGLSNSYPSFGSHFLIEPISMVANAVPLPGGLGGMEFALEFLYETFGGKSGVIVAFAFRFALLCVSALGAVVWFFNRSSVADAMDADHEKFDAGV